MAVLLDVVGWVILTVLSSAYLSLHLPLQWFMSALLVSTAGQHCWSALLDEVFHGSNACGWVGDCT